MRVNVSIRTDNEQIETLNIRGEYMQTQNEHVISYIESLYDNLIIVDKNTNIVTVEKQSTVPNQSYYSKLVFQLGKLHKCTIDVDGYTTFVNVKSTKVTAISTEKQFIIKLEYTIEDINNNVEVIVEW